MVPQVPALVSAGYRVVAPDLRGFGDSSMPDEEAAYALQHVQADVVTLLDALNIVQCAPSTSLHCSSILPACADRFPSLYMPQVLPGGPRLGRSAGVAHGSHPAKARGAPCCHLCRPPRSSPRTTSHILSGCSLPEKT